MGAGRSGKSASEQEVGEKKRGRDWPGVLMLENLGHAEAAAEIERVVAESLRRGDTTADLGGKLTTSEVGDLLAAAVAGSVTA